MNFVKKIEFGNFTLKFGETKVLLDFFEEIVLPSFTPQKHHRKIDGKGDYFFLDTVKTILTDHKNQSHPAIIGRIVKNSKLKREQIFENNKIIIDKKELETAPTSIFVLLLENHRLIFCRELPNAPSIKNFESTCRNFFNIEHEKLIKKLVIEATPLNETKPPHGLKTKILREYPAPKLRITPLSGRQSLSDFIDRFKIIERVTIKLLPTNQEEINNDDFWADFGRRKEEMGSSTTSIQFNGGSKGLASSAVEDQVSAASGMGNADVSFKGRDFQGDTINGNNDDFSLFIEIENLSSKIFDAAKELLEKFSNLISNGIIKVPPQSVDLRQKIQSFFIPK